jgi:hypothetical protein
MDILSYFLRNVKSVNKMVILYHLDKTVGIYTLNEFRTMANTLGRIHEVPALHHVLMARL